MVDKISYEEAVKEIEDIRRSYLDIDKRIQDKINTNPMSLLMVGGEVLKLNAREQTVIDRVKVSFTPNSSERRKLRKDYKKLDETVILVQDNIKRIEKGIQNATVYGGDNDSTAKPE